MTEVNPANQAAANPGAKQEVEKPRERRRIPMNTVSRRLAAQEIPGYRLYWFKESNVPQALDAFYEFVSEKEARIFHLAIGDNPGGPSGNTDLGSHVSIIGGTTEHGQPERLFLMKLKLEWFKEDQRAIAERNARDLSSIFDKEMIVGDNGEITERGHLVYVDKKRTALLNRAIRKAKIGR